NETESKKGITDDPRLPEGNAVTEGDRGRAADGGQGHMGRTGTEERHIAYKPLPSQKRFNECEARFKGLSGPTGRGASQARGLEGRLRDPLATRLCGVGVWTPKGHDWVWRRFVCDKVDGYEAIKAKPYENRHILDIIPDFYQRLERSYDAKFYEQEAMGNY